MKAALAAIASLILLCGTARAQAPTPPQALDNIPVSMLVDLGSEQVLYARKPDLSFLPASMTKVMTAYVAFEEMRAGRLTPGRTFTVSKSIANDWYARGTSMYLEAGTQVSADELLHAIMTGSANDASVVLAKGYAGSLSAWSVLMNSAATELGMANSHFNTPSGWPDEGRTYVSARDLVTLASAMLKRHPDRYRRYVGNKHYLWRDQVLRNRDPLAGRILGADGIKTGYTREAGYNFLGSAERNGRRLVFVVGGAKTSAERAAAAEAIVEWGYSAWSARSLFAPGEQVAQARVQGGNVREVPLVVGREVYAAVPATGDAPVALRVRYNGPLIAPVSMGSQVADLEIQVPGMKPSRIPLYAARTVREAGPVDRLYNGLMNLFL